MFFSIPFFSPRAKKPKGHFIGPYLLLSATPPILYVYDWVIREKAFSINNIFRFLKRREAYFLIPLSWTHEKRPVAVDQLKSWVDSHRKNYPGHRIIYLCNTLLEKELFESKGLEALFCSHNAFSDERIYRPLPGVTKCCDAIYDARISVFKRHYLAAGVKSLALISKKVGDKHIEDYEEQTQSVLAHAHWFNNPFRPDFKVLSPEEVNQALNQCRVGLCLSAQEGAMMASIQYLLAGLPVVSTRSLGGRDVFFEDDIASIVDDTPAAVAAGVQEMIARGIVPETVRAKTLEKVMDHRRRLISLIQTIYDEEGVDRDFNSEWRGLFRNYLLDPDTGYKAILARIR